MQTDVCPGAQWGPGRMHLNVADLTPLPEEESLPGCSPTGLNLLTILYKKHLVMCNHGEFSTLTS